MRAKRAWTAGSAAAFRISRKARSRKCCAPARCASTVAWSPRAIGDRIDVVLSDMAPHTTGDRHSDQFFSEELCARALEIGRQALRPGGHLVAKVFQGGRFPELLRAWKAAFQEARAFHAKDTRVTSSEQYLIGRGLLKSAQLEPPPLPAASPAR